jgi:hypothetical protein
MTHPVCLTGQDPEHEQFTTRIISLLMLINHTTKTLVYLLLLVRGAALRCMPVPRATLGPTCADLRQTR